MRFMRISILYHSHVVKVTEMMVRRARKQLAKVFPLARKTAENDELANEEPVR
jgi:hypothetical protein